MSQFIRITRDTDGKEYELIPTKDIKRVVENMKGKVLIIMNDNEKIPTLNIC